MNKKIYAKRRKQLMQMMHPNAIAILPSAPILLRNRDVEHGFRQDSDFTYLCGFNEPEAVIVLMPKRKQGEFVMFCRERNLEKETWNGKREGIDGVIKNFDADDAFSIDSLDEILLGLMEGRESIYYSIGLNPDFDTHILKGMNDLRTQSRRGKKAPYEFVSLEYLLHDMRLYKSREELSLMKKAAKISVKAHINAMKYCKPGLKEYELEAQFLFEFKRSGADWAYSSIVGGGENACILHYTDNNSVLEEKQMVLIDAGAEYQGYAADITRTFPIDGKFTKEQQEIYELVLKAQEAAFAKVKPGNHWNDPHIAALNTLIKGMIKLGLLKGTLAQIKKDQSYMKYYMHRTGHWLGMDVHDVGDYKVDDNWRILEPNMVLTVEPGLYIPTGSRGAKRWWGIGVRIEDDIVVTKNGYELLSKGLPRTVAEIEQTMAQAIKK